MEQIAFAAESGDKSQVEKVINELDLTINCRGGVLNQTALITCSRGGKLAAICILIELHADVNITNAEGDSALIAAARYGHKDSVSTLIQHGAVLSLQNKFGRSALLEACAKVIILFVY
jgi:ankyrin repeat protein